ncbi:MAG: hypothetical protein WCX31_16755 [Salinivirgaceae bacterium]|jgi:hypothetical protein
MKSTFAIIFTLICLTGKAQDNTQVSRKGFIFGTSLGVANANMNFPTSKQNNTNLAINWKIGYMVNPKLALLVNGAVSIYHYNLMGRARKRDFGGVFPSAQYWVSDKLWILGGIGLGTDAPVFYDLEPDNIDETKYYSGFGVVSSAGYELYRKKNFAVDLAARLNYSSVNLPIGKANGFTSAFLIGINFY